MAALKAAGAQLIVLDRREVIDAVVAQDHKESSSLADSPLGGHDEKFDEFDHLPGLFLPAKSHSERWASEQVL